MMASLIDKDSSPSSTSLVDLFTVPTTQTVVDHSYWYAAHPANTITSDGPYQFNISAGPDYLHLSKNYLYLKLKIVTPEGEPLKATDKVGPINLLAKTFFKQVKVGINGKLAFDSGSMYAYRAFLETELNYSKDIKNERLRVALYEKDSVQHDSASNEGFKQRMEKFKESTVVELMAPLHCDLFLTDRLMISNTQIQLELHRNSDTFALLCFTDNSPSYKIVVEDMTWFVKKVQLTPSIHMAIEATLLKQPAKYPIRRVAMTKLQVGPGRMCTPFSSVFEGQIPRRIVVGFVATDAYFGNYKKCPFVFQNASVNEIYVHAGAHIYPREPLKTDFSRKFYARAYLHLIDTLGLPIENRTNNITLDDFEKSSCFFAFDLTPDECESDNWELVKEGSTSVHCTFAEAIKEPGLEMIVYAEFDNLAMIDRNRAIYFDYSV